MKQLETIASSADNVIHINNFSDLGGKMAALKRKTCDSLPIISGSWSTWQSWSLCSTKCGGGTRSRRRVCDKPAPKNGGAFCKGKSSDAESCNTDACAQVCTKKVEVGIVLDASSSVGRERYQRLLSFLQNLTDEFVVSREGVHFGALHFSASPHMDFKISDSAYWEKNALKTKISQIAWSQGGTKLDRALKMAEEQLFCSSCGLRPGIPKALIIITDGKSKTTPASTPLNIAAQKLKAKGVKIIAVGVTMEADEGQLKQVASSSQDIMLIKDFKYLADKLNALNKKVCVSLPAPAPSDNDLGIKRSIMFGGPQGFCMDKPNGHYHNPADCAEYFSCSDGTTYKIRCPPNLYYNAHRDVCDWHRNAHCTQQVRYQQPIIGYCIGKPDGNYAHPTKCNSFYTCSNGATYIIKCPNDLYFNSKSNRCDFDHNVKCINFTCAGRLNGNYANPSNCSTFYACSNGYLYEMDCPAGLYYNETMDMCDYPRNVRCNLVSFKYSQSPSNNNANNAANNAVASVISDDMDDLINSVLSGEEENSWNDRRTHRHHSRKRSQQGRRMLTQNKQKREFHQCLAGSYRQMSRGHHCKLCHPGFFCPTGSVEPIPCTPGFFCDAIGLVTPAGQCSAGYYCPVGSSVPNSGLCPQGHYCPTGASKPVPCTRGMYCAGMGLTFPSGVCTAGYFCPPGSSVPNETTCPKDHFCPPRSFLPRPCPKRMTAQIGSSNFDDCTARK